MIELDKQWIIWRLIVKKIAVVCLEFMTETSNIENGLGT